MHAVPLCAGAVEWYTIFGADEAVVGEVDARSWCVGLVEKVDAILAWC